MNIPDLGFPSALLRLTRYRRWLVLVPLLTGLLVFGYFRLQKVYYTAYARLLPPQTNSASASALLNQVGGNAAVIGAAALTLKNPSDLYASMLLSRSVQDKVIARFSLGQRYDEPDMDGLRVEVARRTKVTVGKDGVITLAYTDFDPQICAGVANGLIAAMYEVARELARDDTRRRLAFYDNLLSEAREKRRVAGEHLLELEQQTGLTRLKGQEESSASAMAELRGLIATREVEIQRARVVATDRHPEVIRLHQELGALRTQLARLESAAGLKSAASAKQEAAAADKHLLVPFQQYSERRAMVEPARQELESYDKLIADLIRAREFSRGDETRDLSVMQVLDDAVAPTRKSGPRAVINGAVAAVIALLLTTIGVLVLDILFSDERRKRRWAILWQTVHGPVSGSKRLRRLRVGLRRAWRHFQRKRRQNQGVQQ